MGTESAWVSRSSSPHDCRQPESLPKEFPGRCRFDSLGQPCGCTSRTDPTYRNDGLGLKSGLILGRSITPSKTPGVFGRKVANNLIRLSTCRIYAPEQKWVSRAGLNKPGFGGHSEGESREIAHRVNPKSAPPCKKSAAVMPNHSKQKQNQPLWRTLLRK